MQSSNRPARWLSAVGFIVLVFLGGSVAGVQSANPERQMATAVGTSQPARAADPSPEPVATPTIDRLAAPPTVENPSQADQGAQLFWLHCQPCHGDVGQGLTDEWRAQYPPEDQNCWESGCHGRRPYENGFTLPDTVPAVAGEGSLGRFATMADVFAFMRAAMPMQNPGHLSEEEYLAITAFLARDHGLWDGRSLTVDNASAFRLKPEEVSEALQSTVTPERSPTSPSPGTGEHDGENNVEIVLIGGFFAFLLAVGGLWLWRWSVK